VQPINCVKSGKAPPHPATREAENNVRADEGHKLP